MHAVGLGAEAHQVDAADGALRVQGGAAAGMWGACKRAAGSARAEGRPGQSRAPGATCVLRPSSPAGPHTALGSRVPSMARPGVRARSPPSARFCSPRSAPGPHHGYEQLHQQAPASSPSARPHSCAACVPQHRAQGEWKPHGGCHGDTQGEGLCPQWDPLSCSPGVWNTEESSGEQKQPKKMRPLGSEMAQMFLDHRTAPAPHVTTWRCSGWGGPTSAGTAHSPTPPLLPHAVSSASFCSPVPHSCTPPRATPGFVHEVTALSPMFECCLWLRSAGTSVPEAQISLTESGGCTWRPGHEENGG